MNRAAIYHEPDSRYCFAISDKMLVIRLRLAKEDKDAQITLVYGMKYEYYKRQQRIPLPFVGCDHLHAYYEICLPLEDVRLAYIFHVKQGEEEFYYSEGGFFDVYDFDLSYQTYFQMPYVNAVDIHRPVEWMGKGTFYQIFIDRFARGDFEKDDSYIDMAWSDKPTPRSFAGGDLTGITQKMDYLEDLGITALYLTPIFQSLSNHKYDISDYYAIDPQFGTSMALKELIAEAHYRGIKVVLDAVFNHSSHLLPEFQDVVVHGRESKYYDWFMIDGDYPTMKPLNYETFATVAEMPKWNTSNPEVQAYLLDIAKYWIEEYHIDGWRLDVSDEISHEFWRQFRKVVKNANPEAVIIGENWHDAYPYLQGDQFDSIMNYAFSKAILDYVTKKAYDGKWLAETLTNLRMRNTWQVNQMNLNLLDSHDTHRFLNQLGGDRDDLLLSLAILLTFEGSPCLYYGTEIAMAGGYDPDCRRGFDWEKVGTTNPFWVTVRDILRLRKTEKCLQEGVTEMVADNGVFMLKRHTAGVTIELRVNGGNENHPLPQVECLLNHLKKGQELLPKGFALLKYETERS
ncbi:glycoside hydrolase family 13 protein [Streptococcus sp. S784/96/1]|uniref:glycoside hydrolase family 13 protein n=1 Tax=Streptococcus sp. S784/96/1 TaxID=2653499 RepID=UPI001386CFFA|nr:glycoside hydrolase family 13 protein [Streptococcus sp. S784/96/1]